MSRPSPLTRLLVPGPEEALQEAMLSVNTGADAIGALAHRAVVEVVAISGLRFDETRALTREVEREKGLILTDTNGEHAVVIAPLAVIGNLPQRLREWSDATEPLADSIGSALLCRVNPPRWTLAARLPGPPPWLWSEPDQAAAHLVTSADPERPWVSETPTTAAAAVRATPGAAAAVAGGQALVIPHAISGGPPLDAALELWCHAVRALIDTAVAAGAEPAAIAVEVLPGNWPMGAVIARLRQLRTLGRPLVMDCRHEDLAVEVTRAVAAAGAGADVVRVHDAGAVRRGLAALATD